MERIKTDMVKAYQDGKKSSTTTKVDMVEVYKEAKKKTKK